MVEDGSLKSHNSGYSVGGRGYPLSGNEIYDGVDEVDVLQVQVQDEYLTFGSAVVDLYDDAIMGTSYERADGESRRTNSSQGQCQLSQGQQEPQDQTSSCPISPTDRKIALAYTDDLVNDGDTSVSKDKYNKTESFGFRDTRTRRPAVYVGNLTWWTKDEDVIEACKTIGINDVTDVKIYECKLNGQSKGFCSVTFSNELSVALAFEKLGGIKINDNVPLVKPDTKQSLAFFDSMSKTRPPPSAQLCQQVHRGMGYSGGGMSQSGIPRNGQMGASSSVTGMRNQQYPRNNGYHSNTRTNNNLGGYMGEGPPSFYNESSGYPHMTHNGATMVGIPRGPPVPPPHMMNSFNRCDEWGHPQQQYGMMLPMRPGMPLPHMNPAFLGPRLFPTSSGGLLNSGHRTLSGSQSQYVFSEPPPQILPPGTVSELTNQSTGECSRIKLHPNSCSMSFENEGSDLSKMSEEQIEDLLNRNSSVSTAAIKRAVTDAANGEYASAIETLVTAISLIRSSKISKDKRCIVLIDSLHDALEGIENRSYGSGNFSRKGRSGSTDKVRKTYYHRSRSSRSPVSVRYRSRSRERHGYVSYYSRVEDRDSSYRSTREEGVSRCRIRSVEDRDFKDRRNPDRIERDPGGSRRFYEQAKIKIERFEVDRRFR